MIVGIIDGYILKSILKMYILTICFFSDFHVAREIKNSWGNFFLLLFCVMIWNPQTEKVANEIWFEICFQVEEEEPKEGEETPSEVKLKTKVSRSTLMKFCCFYMIYL